MSHIIRVSSGKLFATAMSRVTFSFGEGETPTLAHTYQNLLKHTHTHVLFLNESLEVSHAFQGHLFRSILSK